MRWVWVVALWGCKDKQGEETGLPDDTAPQTTPSCPSPPDLLLGTGAESFTLVEEGGLFPVEPRGGNYFLFPVAGELSGTGAMVAISGEFTRIGTDEIVAPIERNFYALDDYDAETCSGVFYGVPAVLDRPPTDPQVVPCEVNGDNLELRLLVEDLDGCDGASCGSVERTLKVIATADTSGCM